MRGRLVTDRSATGRSVKSRLAPTTAAAIFLWVALAWARSAAAGPVLITSRPIADTEAGDLTFFVGAISEIGRPLKASSLELIIDGQPAPESAPSQALSEWATASSEASQAWLPPVSIGLVYLWVEHIPPGVLDGIQAFFLRVPSRTAVYPTIYGRMRQGRARLTAADVSRLGDVAYLEAYRPNLIEAMRLSLADLTSDPAALKILLVVTDGRDFADPKGEGPGDFAALGREIRKAGITPLVVAFPPPEADRAQAATNMSDLHDAAGGFLRSLDQPQDLENTLESLGQGVADLQRVRLVSPWNWRLFGGSHHLSVKLTAAGGHRLTADIGTASVDPGKLRLLVLGLAAGLLLILGIVIFAMRSRRAPAPDDGAVLAAAHDLIRRGASPQRAAEELTRNHPEGVGALVELDPEIFTDPRFPYFRSRPGRLRLQEIRDILTKKSVAHPVFGDSLAKVLADAVQKRLPPEKAAEMVTVSVGADEWTAFTGLDLEQLVEALRASAGAHPALGTPRARGAAVAIQDALRSRGAAKGIVVGWLVRTGGSGRRGETLRIGETLTQIGQGPNCPIRIAGDPAVAPEHAEISVDGGEFAIAPLGGEVSVEGRPVDRKHPLSDGETIGIGGGLFVFKSASAGNLTGEPLGPRNTGPRSNGPRVNTKGTAASARARTS
jgi:hypothetical protein